MELAVSAPAVLFSALHRFESQVTLCNASCFNGTIRSLPSGFIFELLNPSLNLISKPMEILNRADSRDSIACYAVTGASLHRAS